jgi:hypothetical protein
MVPLPVVVCHERIEGAEQPTFSEEDEAVDPVLILVTTWWEPAKGSA